MVGAKDVKNAIASASTASARCSVEGQNCVIASRLLTRKLLGLSQVNVCMTKPKDPENGRNPGFNTKGFRWRK